MSDDASDRSKLQALAFGPGEQSTEARAAAAARLSELETTRTDPEPASIAWAAPDSLRIDHNLRLPFTLAAIALIAVIATLTSMALVRNQEDSLAVFERPEAPGVEAPSNLLTLGRQLEARRLVVFDNNTVWATRGYPMSIDADGEMAFSEALQVCLIVETKREDGSESWAQCVDEAEFRRAGIELESNWRVEWGPTGPVRIQP